jgi:AraC-like DNA-binding protein
MRAAVNDGPSPFLILIDRIQVIVHESTGVSMLVNLHRALLAPTSISEAELAVIRGVVGKLTARAIYDCGLDGKGLRRILEANSVTELSAGVAEVVADNPTPVSDERIERVLEYLRSHYPDRQTIRLDVLASIAQVTPTHLSRLMRKSTGAGVVAYARKLRITHAVELLNQGARFTDVARKVGYRHQADFSRDFQRVMGVTPGRYVRRGRTSH